MKQCSCVTTYEKYDEEEIIKNGDVLALDTEYNMVTKAIYKKHNHNHTVIGICEKVEGNTVYVLSTGIADVNVTGIICVGDKLTASSRIPGNACAIRYDRLDENVFGIRSIGKVIGLYQNSSKAKVLLDIE